METLEIHVYENITVVDSLPEVMRVIEKIIQNFIESQEEEITIVIKKTSRGPPSLGISVSDGTKIGEALS